MAKANYDFLKYINERASKTGKGLPKLNQGETLFHRVTLEEFINMTFIDAMKGTKVKTGTNPFGEKGFFTLLMKYAEDQNRIGEEIEVTLKDGSKEFIPTKFDKAGSELTYNNLKNMPVHQFFNNGHFSSLGEFVKQNNILAEGAKDRPKFAQSIFKTINTGVNQFNEGPLKIDTSIVDKLVSELANPKQARVVPFIVSNRLTGISSPSESFEMYLKGIDDEINKNQLSSIDTNLTKNERLKAKTAVGMAKAAKAKFLLMATTGFRVGEASSIYRFDPTALTDVTGLQMPANTLAYKNTHYSTFSQVYDDRNKIYRYRIFIPKGVTKTSTQIMVDIPEFVGKLLVEQAEEASKLKTRSIFAYKDYTTGKVIDSYNYTTGAITGSIDNFLFGDKSPLRTPFIENKMSMGYNVDTQQGSTSIKAHDIRRMFSTMVRSFIDSELVEEGQKKALSEAADMFQGRRASLPSAEFRYGSTETPYAGGGATFRLANMWAGNSLLPSSPSLQLINNLELKILNPDDFSNINLLGDSLDNQTYLPNNETDLAIAESTTDVAEDVDKSIVPDKKPIKPKTIEDLRELAVDNVKNYAEKKAFLKMTRADTNISFEDALSEYSKIIKAQDTSSSTKIIKDKVVDTIKKPSVKGTTLGLTALGAFGATALGASKMLPFAGAAAGTASAAEISIRPEEEFEVENSFLSPNVRKVLKAGTAQLEGISPVPTDLSLLNLLPGEQNFRPLNEILFPTKSEISKREQLEKEQAENRAKQLNYPDDSTTKSTEIQMNNLFN